MVRLVEVGIFELWHCRLTIEIPKIDDSDYRDDFKMDHKLDCSERHLEMVMVIVSQRNPM
jgi:hypothetical protein